jgi:hypothetical protein
MLPTYPDRLSQLAARPFSMTSHNGAGRWLEVGLRNESEGLILNRRHQSNGSMQFRRMRDEEWALQDKLDDDGTEGEVET